MPSHLCFSKVNSPPERADTPHRPMADASHLLVVYHCFSDYSGSLAHLLMWNFLGIPSYSSPTSSNAFQYLKNKYFRKDKPNRLPHDAFTSPRDSSSMQFFPRPSSALLWSSCCCPGPACPVHICVAAVAILNLSFDKEHWRITSKWLLTFNRDSKCCRRIIFFAIYEKWCLIFILGQKIW